MSLDLLDKKILYYLDLNSRSTAKQIAKLVRAKKETVHFRINRLKESGYIKNFLTTIHTSQLNKYYYKIFYKFHNLNPQSYKQIITHIKTDSKTAWFGEFEGPYDLAFLIIAESIYDLEEFTNKFKAKFGKHILEQEIHVLTSVHRFNLKFFYQGKGQLHTKYPKQLTKSKIDNKDLQIISLLSNNARISLLDIAKKVNLDSSTVNYRIKKLKKQKVIGTHTLAVDFNKFQVQHYQINFKLINPRVSEKIIAYFSQIKNATFATTTIGKYDLAVEFVAKDNRELRGLIDQAKEKFQSQIQSHDTFLIVKEHNVTWLP
ncbi:Lrp/AsnC family transcriptional regulator [archaeon]|jgi:DNA-binding Lrp family transcriptional regulator|nr:Lrp/AsnC family transcriptional regulator [archaeon]MBT6698106.1 Lrp/AsnC family transcriptional regulator [archaeon]